MAQMIKYKCEVCGEVFEVPAGEEPICPLCGVGKEHLVVVE